MGCCGGSKKAKSATVHPLAQDEDRTDRTDASCEEAPPVAASIRMHLDANRDGRVDAEPCNYDAWTWGAEGTGAVVRAKNRRYNADQQVAERSRISFIWTGPFNENCRAVLTVNAQAHLHIYADRTEGAACLFDGTGPTLDLTTIPGVGEAFQAGEHRLDLWMEATDYPGAAGPLITLTFVSRVDAFDENRQTAVLRIAPWIMASDLERKRFLYVMTFHTVRNGQQRTSNAYLRERLGALAGDIVRPLNVAGNRRYVRDTMRFGTHSAPGHPVDICDPVALRGNQAPLNVPNALAIVDNGIGYIERGNLTNSNYNTGGNLVVSPPIGDDYPWGRIIHGGVDGDENTFCQEWRNFFNAQAVQAPIVLDTRWLYVGHSDEIISFVPVRNEAAGEFRLLLASPKRAYRILRDIDLEEVAEIREGQALDDDATAVTWEQLRPAGEAMDPRDWPAVDFSNNERARLVDAQVRLGNLSQGSGRIFFNRFGHTGILKQKWIDQFLQADPLIQRGNDEPPTQLQIRNRLDALWHDDVLQPGEFHTHNPFTSVDGFLDPFINGRVAPRVDALNRNTDCYPSQLFHNLCIQVKLNHVRAQLQDALDIENDHIINVPIIFEFAAGGAHGAVADMVNLVYIANNNRCIVPEPHGPIVAGVDRFKQAIQQDLAGIGLDVAFINEWHEYHLDDGEIHCGTNQCPVSDPKPWWEHVPP